MTIIFLRKFLNSIFLECCLLYNVATTFASLDKILMDKIQMKAPTENYFPVVLFIMLYKMVLNF